MTRLMSCNARNGVCATRKSTMTEDRAVAVSRDSRDLECVIRANQEIFIILAGVYGSQYFAREVKQTAGAW